MRVGWARGMAAGCGLRGIAREEGAGCKTVLSTAQGSGGWGARGPQDNNAVVKTWGQARTDAELYNHVDLVKRLDIADLEKGTIVAGAPHPPHPPPPSLPAQSASAG